MKTRATLLHDNAGRVYDGSKTFHVFAIIIFSLFLFQLNLQNFKNSFHFNPFVKSFLNKSSHKCYKKQEIILIFKKGGKRKQSTTVFSSSRDHLKNTTSEYIFSRGHDSVLLSCDNYLCDQIT